MWTVADCGWQAHLGRLARVTDSTPQSIPPGWYPDHANPAMQRWWDGTQWTEHTQQAYVAGGVAAEQLKAPEGTNWNTPWIWFVVLLPLLSSASLFLMDFRGYFEAFLSNPTSPNMSGAMSALFSPGYFVAIVLGWLIIALTIVFSYLDWRELKKRGVPQPFHWAFSFLALASAGVVYPIGRAVVTNRRGAGGLVVLWVTIAVFVLGLIIGMIWFFVIFGQIMSLMPPIPTR
jgi:hypothetical protein